VDLFLVEAVEAERLGGMIADLERSWGSKATEGSLPIISEFISC